MTSAIAIHRRGSAEQHDQDLESAFGPGPWLVLAPHDDDAPLGCGLLIAAARAAGIPVHVAVVSDGRMGWNRPEERPGLVERRRRELHAALGDLDLAPETIHELGFSDGDLLRERGCRGDTTDRANDAGLGLAMTRVLRAVVPGAVFTCTPADLHPDHQAVGAETDIACCWASSPIWQELGPPIPPPRCWHYAVYCDFPTPPDRQLRSGRTLLERKLRALGRFDSQPFIADMVERLRADGPVEYFAEATWQPYRPADHAGDFPALGGPDDSDLAAGEDLFDADCRMVAEALAAWHSDPDLGTVMARPLRLVGEGSSRLFPVGFARHLARRRGLPLDIDACGGRIAETAADGRPVLWCSNSGATREVVEAARRLAHPGDRHLLGIGGGPLCSLVPDGRVLLPRPEQAVAATASVWLQAFALGAALVEQGGHTVPLPALRTAVDMALAQEPAAAAVDAVVAAERLWWADAECGLAEELALKCAELLGRDARAVPGTASLHGVEECFASGDLVVLLDADPRDAALRERIAAATGVRWLVLDRAVSDEALVPWAPLLQLICAWRLLSAAACALGRDPARPQRARKVGNPISEQ